jgi:hypothetical protein
MQSVDIVGHLWFGSTRLIYDTPLLIIIEYLFRPELTFVVRVVQSFPPSRFALHLAIGHIFLFRDSGGWMKGVTIKQV